MAVLLFTLTPIKRFKKNCLSDSDRRKAGFCESPTIWSKADANRGRS